MVFIMISRWLTRDDKRPWCPGALARTDMDPAWNVSAT